MSTATAFKYYRTYPFSCGTPSFSSNYDFVDVTLEQEMAFWWNLEDLELVSTGNGPGPTATDINWTVTFGATESLPFTPASITRTGSYYTGTTPARPPRNRVCVTLRQAIVLVASASSGSVPTQVRSNIRMELFPYNANGTTHRIYYLFFLDENVLGGGGLATSGISLGNPAFIDNAFSGFSGTPASSGTIDILGVTFDWKGGGWTQPTSPGSWGAQTVTLSATSAAFTY